MVANVTTVDIVVMPIFIRLTMGPWDGKEYGVYSHGSEHTSNCFDPPAVKQEDEVMSEVECHTHLQR